MPLSLDEATKRYESHSHNIQDLILTMESYMGSMTAFSFNMPQVIGNLDNVDTVTEERNVSSYIKALEEYRRIIIIERKRRALQEIIQGKMKVDDLKMNLKRRRRGQRLAFTHPYQPQQTCTYEQMPPSNAEQMPPGNDEQMPPGNDEQMPKVKLIEY